MSGNRRGNKSGSRGSRGKGKGARDFWGAEPVLDGRDDHAVDNVRPANHPTALVRSLGPLPLPSAAIAEHYFEVVYERTAQLAIALAASADLLEFDDTGSVN